MKKTKEIFVVSIILLTLLFIFFWKTATLQDLFITPDINANDIMGLNYPYKNFLSECLKQKKSFLWASDIYCGYPIHAEGQGGFCYPLNVLLFRFLPTYAAFNYSVILTFFFTGFFTYLYARLLDLSKTSSLFSAIAFMFSGFFVMHVRHLNMIQTACWLPLLFYLLEKYFQTDRTIYVILTGVIFSFQILAGFPQIAYYSFLAILVYFLFGIFRKKKIVQMLLSILIVVIVGIGLSAIQWIPTYELTKLSVRDGGISKFFLTEWAYRFKDLIMFLGPFYYGNIVDATYPFPVKGGLFWENSFYFGILPLILGLFIFIFKLRKNQYLKFFLILILISLIIALHNVFSLTGIFMNILPGFKYFRIHHRILFIGVFSFCIVSGFGFEFIDKRITQRFRRGLIFLILIIIFELFKFGIKQNLTYNTGKWLSKTKTVSILKNLEKDNLFRIISLDTNQHRNCFKNSKGYLNSELYFLYREFLPLHFNMIYDIAAIGGRAGLEIKRMVDFNTFFHPNIILSNNENVAVFLPAAIKLISLMNCKYIITKNTMGGRYNINNNIIENTDFIKVSEILPNKIGLYRNDKCLPRTFIVHHAKFVLEKEKVLEIVTDKNFDTRNMMILEEGVEFNPILINNSKAIITKLENTEVSIEAKLIDDGILFLSDTYYPGWKVFVDNKEEKIYRANYLFRAVPLKKGSHVVKFIFEPLSYKIGKYISIITFLLVVLSIIGIYLKLPKKS
ncbi:MAG: YfhO family protein [Elusimicrobia bacterium]|nr:YfhO family protein [Elusimicrobiota bacterium]